MRAILLTPYQRHCKRWADGCGSEICTGARKVFCRGTVPCDVLFIGEAPGESEEAVGKPFIGPAGKLMDHIIRRAIQYNKGGFPTLKCCLTNLVCCIPRNEEEGGKADEPPDSAIRACKPRLEEFIRLAQPRLVVAVGNHARDWLDPKLRDHVEVPVEVKVVSIQHPAYMLRQNQAQRDLLVQRAVVTIVNAVEEL